MTHGFFVSYLNTQQTHSYFHYVIFVTDVLSIHSLHEWFEYLDCIQTFRPISFVEVQPFIITMHNLFC